MEYSHEESLLSVVEDFSPQPSPNPADFSDSDRDEREEEEPLGFGVKLYMFEPLSTASSAAEPAERERESMLIPATCDLVQRLITESIYMMGEGSWGDIWERILSETKLRYAPKCRMSHRYL